MLSEKEVLAEMVSLIENAGLLNLSNGVQLGATSWYVKMSDCMESAKAVLAEREGPPVQPEAGRDVVDGVKLIAFERERQIKAERWTSEHDDEHKYGELAAAASCYAHHANCQVRRFQPSYIKNRPSDWPWDAEWWKPSAFPIRNLVKAGALIAAEVDRLQRLAQDDKPHTRVEIVKDEDTNDCYDVYLDGRRQHTFCGMEHAKRYAAGLRAEINS
jgi:hypothetical protein